MINKIRTLLDVQIKLEQRKLENGTVVEAESFEIGKEVFIKTEDEKVAMPIGEYQMEAGELMLVAEEGIIAEINKLSETEDEEMRDDGKEAAVDDWEGMEKRIKNLEDAVADLKKDKEPRSEEVKEEDETTEDLKEVVESSDSEENKELTEELSKPATEPIKHSPEAKSQIEMTQFSKKKAASIMDSVLNKIINN